MKKGKILRRIRRIVGLFRPVKNHLSWDIEYIDSTEIKYHGQKASDIIKDKILDNKPLLVTRFGSNELMCVMDSTNQLSLKNTVRYLLGITDYLGWRPWTREQMSTNAGFYPATDRNLAMYGRLIIDLMPEIDILGSIWKQEQYFEKLLESTTKIALSDMEPFRHENPWTASLKGKRVLVIHPFEATILHQYKYNRSKLFINPNVLPEFELQIIKAVQSLDINRSDEFTSWFEAFNHMKAQIDQLDFHVAIIGCGAYGMPLAAYIKSLGRKAIHMGGATQYLFGIKSKRGEDIPEIRKYFNEHWIRPLPEDYPKGYEKIEDGCYW